MFRQARAVRRATRQMPARAVAASLRLSHSYNPAEMWDLPVVASPGAVITRKTGSEMKLGGTLFLGYGPPAQGRRRSGEQRPAPRMGRAAIELGRGARLSTGGWVVLHPGTELRLFRDATLDLAEGVYLNEGVKIHAHEAITIGAGSGLSWDCLVLDSDLHTLSVGGEIRPMRAPVTIGEGVWVGARCIVTKGVTIGDGAVIGAGSVVVNDIPARCLAAGVPARVVREDVEWWP